MDDLKVKFKQILKQNTEKIDRNNTVYSTLVTKNAIIDFQSHSEISELDISQLRSIAVEMSSAGRLGECVETYKSSREVFLETCFRRLDVQQLSENDVASMSRDHIMPMIDNCRRAAYVFVVVLFPKEESLCHQIFSGLEADPFLGVIEEHATQLFDFAEALSCTPPSHENLIKILALHEALSGVLPHVTHLFKSSKSLETIRDQVRGTIDKLAEVLSNVLFEFPAKVLKSNVSTNHPNDPALPRYVIKSIMIPMISSYKETLINLVVWNPSKESYNLAASIDLDFVEVEGETSPLSLHLMWIIVNLVYNLRGTSRSLYNDNKIASLRHLFNMKNIGYIVEKIEGCPELKQSITAEFLHKLAIKFHSAIQEFLSLTSQNISKCLKKSASAENLGKFNDAFVDLRRSLASIVILDPQLRENYRRFVSDKLVPQYTSFHLRLQNHNIAAQHSPDELARRINLFFRDTPNSRPDW